MDRRLHERDTDHMDALGTLNALLPACRGLCCPVAFCAEHANLVANATNEK